MTQVDDGVPTVGERRKLTVDFAGADTEEVGSGSC